MPHPPHLLVSVEQPPRPVVTEITTALTAVASLRQRMGRFPLQGWEGAQTSSDIEDYTTGSRFPSTVGINGTGGVQEAIAQAFPARQAVTQILVGFDAQKGGTPSDTFNIEIRTDSGGAPSSTILGSASIPSASLGTTRTSYQAGIVLSSALAMGVTYWVVFTRTGSFDSANRPIIFLAGPIGAPAVSDAAKQNSGVWLSHARVAVTLSFVASFGGVSRNLGPKPPQLTAAAPTADQQTLTVSYWRAVASNRLTRGRRYPLQGWDGGTSDESGYPFGNGDIPENPSGAIVQGSGGTNEAQAEAFVAPVSGTLTSVRFKSFNVGTPTDNLVAALQADSAGSPSGTDLAAITIVRPLGGNLLLQAGFGVSVTAGTTYWLVFRRSGARDTSNYWAVGEFPSDVGSIGKVENSGVWSIGTQLPFNANISVPGRPLRGMYQRLLGPKPPAVIGPAPTADQQTLTVSYWRAVQNRVTRGRRFPLPGWREIADLTLATDVTAWSLGPKAGTNTAFGTVTTIQKAAVRFVPVRSGVLSAVTVALAKVNSPTDNVVVELQSNSGGQPSGTRIGFAASISGASLSPFPVWGNVTVVLSSPVVAGTTYWIVVSRDGALDNTDSYAIGETEIAKPAGQRDSDFNGATWGALRDLYSQIVVTATGAPGNLPMVEPYLGVRRPQMVKFAPFGPLEVNLANASARHPARRTHSRKAPPILVQPFVPIPPVVTTITTVEQPLERRRTERRRFPLQGWREVPRLTLGLESFIRGSYSTPGLALGFPTNEKRGLAFTASRTGQLGPVTLALKTVGSPTDNVAVQLYDQSVGVPSTPIGPAALIPSGSLSSSFTQQTVFLSAPVVAGTFYYIVVVRDGAIDGSNYYVLAQEDFVGTSDVYYNGSFWGGSSDLWYAATITGTSSPGNLPMVESYLGVRRPQFVTFAPFGPVEVALATASVAAPRHPRRHVFSKLSQPTVVTAVAAFIASPISVISAPPTWKRTRRKPSSSFLALPTTLQTFKGPQTTLAVDRARTRPRRFPLQGWSDGTAADGLRAVTNLVANGGFETDLSGWFQDVYVLGTLTRSTAWSKFGTASLRFTVTDPTIGRDNGFRTTTGSGGIPVTAGTAYTLSMWVNLISPGQGVFARIYWYDSGGAFLTQSDLTPNVTTTGVSLITLTATAVANAAFASVSLQTVSDGNPIEVHADGVQFETGSVAHGYVETNGAVATNYQPAYVFPSYGRFLGPRPPLELVRLTADQSSIKPRLALQNRLQHKRRFPLQGWDGGSVASNDLTTATNLIQNPDAEPDVVGIIGTSGATVTRVTSQYHSGAASAQVQTPGSVTNEGNRWRNRDNSWITALPNSTYELSVWTLVPVGATAVVRWDEYTDQSRATGFFGGTGKDLVADGTWHQTIISVRTQQTTGIVVPLVETITTAQAITYYVDDASLVATSGVAVLLGRNLGPKPPQLLNRVPTADQQTLTISYWRAVQNRVTRGRRFPLPGWTGGSYVAGDPGYGGLNNTAEGGSNGVTVDSLGANTGGASGDAFSIGRIGTGAILEFSNAVALDRSLAYRAATRATPSTAQLIWNNDRHPALVDNYGQMLCAASATPTATMHLLLWGSGGVDATGVGRLLWDTNNHILIQDTSNTVVATSATVLTPGKIYRVQWHHHAATSGSTLTVRIYDYATSQLLEEFSGNLGGTSASTDSVAFGLQNDTNAPTSTGYLYLDDLVSAATNWPGVMPAFVLVSRNLGPKPPQSLNRTPTADQQTLSVNCWRAVQSRVTRGRFPLQGWQEVPQSGSAATATPFQQAVLDNFDRADGGLTAPWARVNFQNLYITSNQIGGLAGGSFTRYMTRYEGIGSLTDCEFYATLAHINDVSGVGARSQQTADPTGQYLGYWFQYQAGTLSLFLENPFGSNETTLAQTTITLNDGDKLGIRCIGSTIEGWVCQSGVWSKQLTAIDSTFSSGYPALEQGNDASFTGRMDDFGGGPPSTLSPLSGVAVERFLGPKPPLVIIPLPSQQQTTLSVNCLQPDRLARRYRRLPSQTSLFPPIISTAAAFVAPPTAVHLTRSRRPKTVARYSGPVVVASSAIAPPLSINYLQPDRLARRYRRLPSQISLAPPTVLRTFTGPQVNLLPVDRIGRRHRRQISQVNFFAPTTLEPYAVALAERTISTQLQRIRPRHTVGLLAAPSTLEPWSTALTERTISIRLTRIRPRHTVAVLSEPSTLEPWSVALSERTITTRLARTRPRPTSKFLAAPATLTPYSIELAEATITTRLARIRPRPTSAFVAPPATLEPWSVALRERTVSTPFVRTRPRPTSKYVAEPATLEAYAVALAERTIRTQLVRVRPRPTRKYVAPPATLESYAIELRERTITISLSLQNRLARLRRTIAVLGEPTVILPLPTLRVQTVQVTLVARKTRLGINRFQTHFTIFPPRAVFYNITALAGMPFTALQALAAVGSGDPVESTQSIAATSGDPMEANQTLSVTQADPYEAEQNLMVSGSDPAESNQAIAGTTSDPLEANQGIQALLGVVFEALQMVAVTDSAPLESEQTITASLADIFEALQALAATKSMPFESLLALAIIALAPVEALQLLKLAGTSTAESTQPVQVTGSDPAEALQGVSQSGSDPVEITQGITNTTFDAFEALQGIAVTSSLFLEALQAISRSGADPIESAEMLTQVAQFAYEALQGIRATASDAYETQQSTVISQTSVIPFEVLQALAGSYGDAWESTAALRVTSSLPAETLQEIAATYVFAIESLLALVVSDATVVEALQALAVTGLVRVETLAGIVQSSLDVIESEKSIAASSGAPLEALQALNMVSVVAFEALQSIQKTTSSATEALQGIASTFSLAFEALQAIAVVGASTIDTQSAVAATSSLVFEVAQALAASTSVALEALTGIDVTTAVFFETNQQLQRVASDALEALQSISASGANSLETLQAISATWATMFEALQGIAAISEFAYESQAQATISQISEFAIEYLQTLTGIGADPVEAQQQIAVTGSVDPFEALRSIAASASDPLEALQALRGVSTLISDSLQTVSQTGSDPFASEQTVASALADAVEALQGLQSLAAENAESAGTVSQTGSDTVEALQALAASGSQPIEALQALAVLNVVAFEALLSLRVSGTDPLESLQALAVSANTIEESVSALTTSTSAPAEALQTIQVTLLANFDATQALTSLATLVAESQQTIQASFSDPVEASQAIQQTLAAAIEVLKAISALSTASYETQSNTNVSQVADLAIETLQSLATSGTDPIESVQAISSTLLAQIEALKAIAAAESAPLEALQALVVLTSFSTESTTTIIRTGVDGFEALQLITLTGLLAAESVQQVGTSSGSGPVEAVQAVNATLAATFEALQSIQTLAGAAYETLANTPVSQTTLAAFEALQSLAVSASQPDESTQPVTGPLLVPVEVLQTLAFASSASLEALVELASASVASVETLQGFAQVATLSAETMQALRASGVNPYEAQQGLQALTLAPIDAVQAIQALAGLVAETLQPIQQTAGSLLETLTQIAETAALAFEALQAIQTLAGEPYETQASTYVTQTSEFPIEFLRALAVATSLASESAATVATSDDTPVEATQAISQTAESPNEILQALALVYAAPFEALLSVTVSGQTTLEALRGLAEYAAASAEAAQALASTAIDAIETLTQIAVSGSNLPLEALQAVAALSVFSYEAQSSTNVIAITDTQIETLAAARGVCGLALEALASAQATSTNPAETLTVISSTLAAAFETTQMLSALAGAPVESLQAITQSYTFAIEFAQALAASLLAPVETTAGVTESLSEPLESTQATSTTSGLSYESLVALAAVSAAAYETLLSLTQSGQDALEALAAVAATGRSSAESLLPLTQVAVGIIEALVNLTTTTDAPAETLQGLAITSDLPFEAGESVTISQTATLWLETLTALTVSAVNRLEALASISQLSAESVESSQRLAASLLTPLEVLQALRGSNIQPVESSLTLTATVFLPAETLQRLANADSFAVESAQKLAVQALAEVEALQALSSTLTMFIEGATRISITQTALLPLDSQQVLQVSRSTPLESQQPLSKLAIAAAEALVGVRQSFDPTIEALGGQSARIVSPLEAVALLQVLATTPIEALAPRLAVYAVLPLETTQRLSETIAAPVEYFVVEIAGVVILVDKAVAIAILADEPTTAVIIEISATGEAGLIDEPTTQAGLVDESLGDVVLEDSDH